MIKDLIIRSITNFVSITYADSIYFLKMMILTSFISLVFLFWMMFFKDISFKLQNNFINFSEEHFNNLKNGQFIMLSLSYKINSLKVTIIKICIHFVLTFSLKFLRLGTELNLNTISIKLSWFPYCIQLNIILLLCIYVYIFKSFWGLITNQLYFELKKAHIYLQQFNAINGVFVTLAKRRYSFISYYYFIIIKILRKINSFIRKFYIFYEDKKYLDIAIIEYYATYKQVHEHLKATKYMKISQILMFFYYFCIFSKYRETLVVKGIKAFIKQIHFGFWTIAKILPAFIVIIAIILEYKYNNGIIKHSYYIIFVTFIYKIIIDLLYFYSHTIDMMTEFICICYYNINDMHEVAKQKEGRGLFNYYQSFTQFDSQLFIQHYLLNGLIWVRHKINLKEIKDRSSKTFIQDILERIENTSISKQIKSLLGKINNLIYP